MIQMPNGLLAREETSDEGTWHDVFDKSKAWHRHDLKNPRLIVDLGAYCGYTTYDFLDQYKGTRVLAIEPDLENYELLKTNVLEIDNHWRVTFVRGAVWNYSGYGVLIGDHFNAKKITKGSNTRVYTLDEALNLDSYFAPPNIIDFIKFDIEGAEREVLKAATTAIWPHRTKCIKVEVHDEYYVSDCIYDLNRIGFTAKQVGQHPGAVLGWQEKELKRATLKG